MFKKLLLALVAASALFVVGCASVPMASSTQDQKAKTFAVAEGKANLYIYRDETLGAAIKMPVVLDGKLLGQTASKTYFLTEVTPGKHSVLSSTENTSTLDLVIEAGKNYFVWQEVKMGMWAAQSKLQLVDEAKGKAAVANCKLIQGQ